MKLKGVDGARMINPGMTPCNFFAAVLAFYVLIFLTQGGVRIRKSIR
jgi:hypothetical protein